MSKKLISFMIDPNLDRLWVSIGLTKVEKAAEAKKLEMALIQAYQKFIEETSINCEDLRAELRNAIIEYQHVQQTYGDEEGLPPLSPKYSLRDQINYMADVTEELRMKYESRNQEFNDIYEILLQQFELLKIDEEGRGEFAEIGSEDLTVDRLERFKQHAKKLDIEIQQRKKLFTSITQQIQEIADYIQEPLSEQTNHIIENNLIDNDSISVLQKDLSVLQELRESNEEQIDMLWNRVAYLYEVLATESRLSKPQNPSAENTDILLNEIMKLQKEAENNLPTVIKEIQREIKKTCDELRVSPVSYLKFTGDNDDLEAKAIYLRNQLNSLKQKQIKAQPIISLISEIESAKASLKNDPTKSYMSKERGSARRRVEEEKNRKVAQETIPKMEQKLLKMLAQFKEENNYEFQFEGLDLSEFVPENTRRETSKQTLGRTLLLQKLQENNNNHEPANQKQMPRRRVPRF